MSKFTVEMCVAQNVTIEGIEAENESEAIDKAKLIFSKDPDDYVGMHDFAIDEITYVGKER